MHAQTNTQQRILEAARDLMHGRSYADVGVAAICQQAGIKKGSFYHFFASKQELVLAVLETIYLDTKQGLLDQTFQIELRPMQRLARFAQHIYEFQLQIKQMTGHVVGCPFGNLASELATQDEVIRDKVSDIFTRLQQSLRQCLQEAIAGGELPTMDITATAEAMFAYMEGVMLLAKTHNDPEILRRLLPAMTQLHIPIRDEERTMT